MSLVTKMRTGLALGVPNIARAMGYRLGVRLGLNPVRRLRASVPQGPFFRAVVTAEPIKAPAVGSWHTSALLFGRWPVNVSEAPPDWLSNPLTGQQIAHPDRQWWKIPDFDPVVGDIKIIWELSRMDWVLAFAQRVRQGDERTLERLNVWLADWCNCNPPYRGPNWKCGQEASLRVMHLAMAALMLDQIRCVLPGLRSLLQLHLQRIAPTVNYAMAQDNNHGTSEAAAMYIGGSWLDALGDPQGRGWQEIGRRWLENRVARLIGDQGSFSQYSLNYHRVMLDTLSMVEVWRRALSLPEFSARWRQRALAATKWLRHMVNAENGDGPNTGANDGARLLQLADTAYRDYRPSVTLAMALFAGQRAYAENGEWNDPLVWLGVPLPTSLAAPVAQYVADDGGFAIMRRGKAMAMMRYPRFRFRPSQADVLHVDLWIAGENLLRDAGTYSYNTEPEWLGYFGGTASHNTMQFDGRDQMPRLGRFLLGNWLTTSRLEALREDGDAYFFAAGYQDKQGAAHFRRIRLSADGLCCEDDASGLFSRAVLRWRLAPGAWRRVSESGPLEQKKPQTSGLVFANDRGQKIVIRSSAAIARSEIVEGWESRHYLEKMPLSVLEVEVAEPCTITTEVYWS